MNSNHIRVSRVIISLLFCVTLVPHGSPADPARWEDAIAAFERGDKEQFPQPGMVLFVGSSSIRMWKTLETDFRPIRVLNRGFGGSQIEDSIHFADRIIIPYRPAAIVLYASDNDIAAGKKPAHVLADFERFAAIVGKALPDIPIFFITIKPSLSRWSLLPKMKRANELIETLSSHVDNLEYLDVASAMLKDDGTVRGDLFLEDNLHLNEHGYRLWTSIIKPRMEARLR